MWRDRTPGALLVRVQNGTAAVGTGWQPPTPARLNSLPYDPATSEYILGRIESTDSKRYLYTRVHSSTVHDSQVVEGTQVFMKDERINHLWLLHTCSEIP